MILLPPWGRKSAVKTVIFDEILNFGGTRAVNLFNSMGHILIASVNIHVQCLVICTLLSGTVYYVALPQRKIHKNTAILTKF